MEIMSNKGTAGPLRSRPHLLWIRIQKRRLVHFCVERLKFKLADGFAVTMLYKEHRKEGDADENRAIREEDRHAGSVH